jgi:hypothetical protein
MQKLLLRLVILLFFVSVTVFVHAGNGYEIKVKIAGVSNSKITLAHYFAKENLSFFKDDSAMLNKKGEVIFSGSKPLAGGMYILILSKNRYFDLLIGDNQHFSVETDTTDLVRKINFKGSPENEQFYAYRNVISGKSAQMKALNQELSHATPVRKDSIRKERKAIDTEVKEYIRQSIEHHKGSFFAVWLRALQEIEIPPFPRDAKGNVTDSTFQYNYWHRHFFDNFDLADVRLLHTPFYEKKVVDYLNKVVVQIPDSIQKETDLLLSKAGKNKEVQRYLLGTLYNQLADKANKIVGMDGPFAYFAEKQYLPQATWADQTFMEDVKKEIEKIKPTILGKVTPELPLAEIPTDHFIVAQTDTTARKNLQVGRIMKLQEMKTRYTVLVFWEVDCGHCQKEIPLLYDSIRPLLAERNAQIVAIHMLTGMEAKVKWVNFVNQHKLYEWINAVPLDYSYKDRYNIISTPTIYLLDENQRIISKRIGIKQLTEVIDMERKRGKRP